MTIYRDYPPEQRFIIEVWDWRISSLKEHARCATYEEAERILEQARGPFSSGRIIEVRKAFTDQY